MHDKLRHRLLVGWSRLLSHRPRTVLAVTLALAGAAVLLTSLRLQFQSDRNALLDDDLPWNQRFIDWTQTFAGTSDLFVVIDLDPSSAGRVTPEAQRRGRQMADEIGTRLVADTAHIREAVWRFDAGQINPRMIRLLGAEEFARRLDELAQAGPVLSSATPGSLVASAMGQMLAGMRGAGGARQPTPEQASREIAELTQLIDTFHATLADTTHTLKPFQAMNGSEWEYLSTDNGRLLFVRITPTREADTIASLTESIDAIRAVLAEVNPRYPTLDAGLTGIEVIENDETEIVTRDSTVTSIVALLLIAVVLVSAFHSFRTPLLALAALLVGVAWAFGFLTLSIGHLQVLSVFFTVILLGLGIAYGIHLASRFELVRHRYADSAEGFADALRDVFSTMGPGIVTGAITTSAAFATTLLTDFRGVAEMGLIAAVGIVLCLLAMFSVFPALLRLYKPLHEHVKPMRGRFVHLFEERWITPFVRRPILTLLVAGVVTLLSIVAVTQMRFNYNLEELLPRDVDSVLWQRRIVEAGQSIYSGVSVVESGDLAEARRRAETFRRLPTVSDVRGIGLLFPADEARKLEQINTLRSRLGAEVVDAALAGNAPANAPPHQPDLTTQLAVMKQLMTQFAGLIPQELRPSIDALRAAIDRTLDTLGAMTPEQRQRQTAHLQEQYTRWRQRIAQTLDPAPLTLSDLPSELVRSYVDPRGRLALEVHPRLDPQKYPNIQSPLDDRFLPEFHSDLAGVDPSITGVIVQYYLSGKMIWESYRNAAVYAMLLVFVLVWIDFRSLRDALFALVPVAAGFVVTFAVMYLLGMDLNAANITVLPLMFGIGVDSGVHVIHRYRQEPTARPLGLTEGTGKAITITSLTTMIGFGTLMLAHHRGIASLGFVLSVGVGMTLLACWTIMPAWLEVRTRPVK